MSYDGLLKRLNIIKVPQEEPGNEWLPVSDFLSGSASATQSQSQPQPQPSTCVASRSQKMQRAQLLKDFDARPAVGPCMRDEGPPTTRAPFEPLPQYVAVENSAVVYHSLVCPAPAFCTERCRMWTCRLWEQNEHEPLNNDHPMSLCRECKTILWLRPK